MNLDIDTGVKLQHDFLFINNRYITLTFKNYFKNELLFRFLSLDCVFNPCGSFITCFI